MFQKVMHDMYAKIFLYIKYLVLLYEYALCILEVINYRSEIEQDINFQRQGNKSQITIYGVIVSDNVFLRLPVRRVY